MTPQLPFAPDYDVHVSGLWGTVLVFELQSDAVRTWFDDHVAYEPWQQLGPDRIAIDHRPAGQLLEGLQLAGFSIRLT